MLKKLTERVYYMDYDDDKARPLLGLVAGEKGSLVIDAGNSYEHVEEFLNLVKKLGIENAKYLGITHWHWDHVFGIGSMGLTSIGSIATQNKLLRLKSIIENKGEFMTEEGNSVRILERVYRNEKTTGLIDIGFEAKLNLDLGSQNCFFEWIGGDHSVDSTLILAKEDKVMFLGDSPYRGFFGKKRVHTLENVRRISEEILKHDCDYFLTSHKPIYSRRDIEDMFRTMIEIGEVVGDSLDKEGCVSRYENLKSRHIDPEESFYLEAYVEGNKVRIAGK